MTDIELQALAAVVNAEVANVIVANQDRVARGEGMAYDNFWSDAARALEAELIRRGVIK